MFINNNNSSNNNVEIVVQTILCLDAYNKFEIYIMSMRVCQLEKSCQVDSNKWMRNSGIVLVFLLSFA